MLREDLPTVSTLNERWSEKDLSMFNAFREFYRFNVNAIAKKLYEKDVVRHVPKEIKEAVRKGTMVGYSMMAQMELGKENMLQQHIDDEYRELTGVDPSTFSALKKIDSRKLHCYMYSDIILQLLRKVRADKKGVVNLKSRASGSDIITAIYVPTFIGSIDVVCPNFVVTFTLDGEKRPLCDVLKESKLLPSSKPQKKKEYVHEQLKVIAKNGVSYQRIEILQPYLPTAALAGIQFFDVHTGTRECTIYVEENVLNGETFATLNSMLTVLYCDNPNTPLLYVQNGDLCNAHIRDEKHLRSKVSTYIPRSIT